VTDARARERSEWANCEGTGSAVTDHQEALKETVRAFTRREIVPHLDAWERDGEVPRDLHTDAA